MLLGLVFYLSTRHTWLRGVGLPPERLSAAGRLDLSLTPVERRRMLGIAIITLFVVFFWLAFEQMGSSLNVFAAHRTDRLVGGAVGGLIPGGEIPAAWFQAINPFFILMLAPIVAGIWRRLGPSAPSTPAKMALGLILLGVAYMVMMLGAAQSEQGTRVSPWFLVAFYFLFSCGELCFLPVGISYVSQTAPARFASMVMGAWLTANFFASLAGGYLAGMVQRIERGEVFTVLGGQADFYLIFVVSCLLTGGLLTLLVPTLKRLI
jgi:POT family proton-dependent oligopeptide transporter